MISAYRIVAKRWQETAISGDGAKEFPGRWNSRGISMIYTAESRALAMLEILVHLESDDVMQENFIIIPIQIQEDNIMSINSNLPNDWRENPAPVSTRLLGDEWAKTKKSLVLAVPSTLVPQEYNYLINPSHPDFNSLIIGAPQPLDFDPRLSNA